MRGAAICTLLSLLACACSEKQQSFDERYAAQQAKLAAMQNEMASEMRNRMELGNAAAAP